MSSKAPLPALLERGRVLIEGLPPAGLAYLVARERRDRPLLLVTADDDRAERLSADLAALGVAGVELFPGEPHVPFEEVSPDPRLVYQRLSVRYRVLAGSRPPVIVASAAAVQGLWMPDTDFLAATERWAEGDEVPRDRLTRTLVRCGFQPVSLVEDEGTFALRGGIVDLFPPGSERPVRVDLFGDEIASIKRFEPGSQRTGESLAEIVVHPIREVIFDDASVARARARLQALADSSDVPTRRMHGIIEEIESRNYFFGVEALWPAFYDGGVPVLETLLGDGAVVVLDHPDAIRDTLTSGFGRAEHERERAIEHHRPALGVEEHLALPARVYTALDSRAAVLATPLSTEPGVRPLRLAIEDWTELSRELSARREDASRGEILDPLVSELRRRVDERHDLLIACGSRSNAERLRELLLSRKLDVPVLEGFPDPASLGRPRRSPRVALVVAGLSAGIRDEATGVAILTDIEIFGATRPPAIKRRRRAPAAGLATLKDLGDGDPVIHVDHGIGRYLGLKRLILDGIDGDYVHLEYAGGDRLYVPVYRLSLLQRYRGPVDGVRLDKLGGSRWLRAKQRVKDAVLALAHELLAIQARRKTVRGVALPPPDEHFRAFEATFPFEETPDQQRAIDEVIADLTRDTPTDRLVCGDVGFGKTEVAVRAAVLAVMGGKQVAVLVPTTVLAEQHGETFRERLHGEGINVEVLSRFRSPAELRDLLERARGGRLDVLIGTHRMLSSDVAFKNLGLLVVDEEQRFGVKQKERIKQLRAQLHVVTLSATPIPRTLNMAASGLRDLSIIQTPPAERVSIRTEVTRFDEEIVQEAIRRELHRGGQVFVVHNRVRSIAAMAELVRRLVPEARVAVAHGQMSGERLERIMVEFVHRQHNVLVSTAIIESGLDIPTANTMIVNRADMFGLSQLYQLRGRIGRGRDRGYAYLLLPHSDRVRSEAVERLAVLKRFSELGSGFQVATHDLELRGAGDLLGADQSGNIAAVGFELYTELLDEAVEQARGQGGRADVEPEIKLPVAAVLPEDYVPEPMNRLGFYQRMAQSETDAAIFDVLEEIEERYGRAPDEVRHLLEVMVIRRRLKALGAMGLSAAVDDGIIKLGLTFVPEPALDRDRLARKLVAEPGHYKLLPSGRLMITAPASPGITPAELLRSVRHEVGLLAPA